MWRTTGSVQTGLDHRSCPELCQVEDIVSSGDETGGSAEDTGGRCCGGQVFNGEELSSAVGERLSNKI